MLNNYPGWLTDLIHEWKCGFAIQPDNPEVFADTLETAANDLSQLEIMGKNGRLLAVSKFNRRELAAQFTKCLEDIHAMNAE